MDYTCPVIEIRKSDTYEQWFRKLKDRQAQARDPQNSQERR